MPVRITAFTSRVITLDQLISDLRGLFAASDIKDRVMSDQFEELIDNLDKELELRTEAWAPAGSASDANLAACLDDLKVWLDELL